MLVLIVTSSFVCVALTVLFFVAFREMVREVKSKDWGEVGVSVLLMAMYALLVIAIAMTVRSSLAFNGF
jgi:hypothetical protein